MRVLDKLFRTKKWAPDSPQAIAEKQAAKDRELLEQLRAKSGIAITGDERTTSSVATMKDIWEDPQKFNRATRRAAHLFGRMWRWGKAERNWRAQAPRYIRRHYGVDTFAHPKTRRTRRQRARITRMIIRKGLQ